MGSPVGFVPCSDRERRQLDNNRRFVDRCRRLRAAMLPPVAPLRLGPLMRSIVAQLVVLGLAGAASAQAPTAWRGTLHVRVLDERGRPIEGAGAVTGPECQITSQQALRAPQARSDAAGDLRIAVGNESSYRWWQW